MFHRYNIQNKNTQQYKMKNYLKRLVLSNSILKKLYFGALVVMGRAYCYKNTQPVLFEGWGMVSVNKPSWMDSENNFSKTFLESNSKIIKIRLIYLSLIKRLY